MSSAPTYESTLKHHGLTNEQMEIICSDGVILALVQHMKGWRNIAPYLEVDDSVVDAMTVDEERKRRELLERWKAKFGHEATLERLARCFLSAGKAALADLVCEERKKTILPASIPQLTSATPQLTSATPQPMAVSQERSSVDSAGVTSIVSPLATPQTSAVSEERVAEVRESIDKFEEDFFEIQYATEESLSHQACRDPKFFNKFRAYLRNLPHSKRAVHSRFFSKHLNIIIHADNIDVILDILRHYCSYTNYELILHLVKKFCEAELKQRMLDYRESFRSFEMSTTIDVYLCAISARPELGEICEGFIRMAMKINKPPSECTLYEIRQLNEEIAKNSSLEPFSIYTAGIATNCVRVVLGIHPECVESVVESMTPDFHQTHHLTEVSIDGRDITFCRLTAQLYVASEGGEMEQVVSLISVGADVNYQDEWGWSALMMAARSGRTAIVQELVKSGATLDIQNEDGWSALILAAWRGHTAVVKELVKSGATLDIQNNYGWSALMKATSRGHTAVVQELVKSGATLDIQNEDGWSALIWAARCGHAAVAQELVKSGATLDIQTEGGLSALMMAAREGHTAVVQELVKSGATLDIQNEDGWSALMMAARCGHTAVVQELVKSGATLDIQNKSGDSAVMLATVEHHSDILQELVRAGADLNLVNQEGFTVLMIAARSGRTELVGILLTGENINIDYQMDTGWSALFFSAGAGHVATTQSLLRAGASPHINDKDGLIALDVATASEHDAVCELLRKHLPSTTTLRSRLSQALKTLAKRSGQRVKQLFIQLDIRLKSTDLKTEHQRPEVKGQREQGVLRKKRFIRPHVPTPGQLPEEMKKH